jgi:ferredoxin
MNDESSDPALQIAFVGVDRDLCQTAATCLAYHLYELDDESKAVLLTANGSNSDEPGNVQSVEGYVSMQDLLNPSSISKEEMQRLVLESAKACPFNAIIAKAADGTVIWPSLVCPEHKKSAPAGALFLFLKQ